MLCQGKSRFCCVIRTLITSSKSCANHYDVLGITPKATQGDIKSAYYKLSKVYHPDKSKDEESAIKFRAITEAYKVLGNIKLKKMYDRGLLTGRDNTTRMEYHPEPEPTEPELKFYKSRMQNNISRTIDGRTPIYDFDSWSKNHYGDLFKKSQYEKESLRKRHTNVKKMKQSTNEEMYLYVVFGLGVLFIALVVTGQSDYDTIQVQKNNPVSIIAEPSMEPQLNSKDN